MRSVTHAVTLFFNTIPCVITPQMACTSVLSFFSMTQQLPSFGILTTLSSLLITDSCIIDQTFACRRSDLYACMWLLDFFFSTLTRHSSSKCTIVLEEPRERKCKRSFSFSLPRSLSRMRYLLDKTLFHL